jgi:hypothetical protein
MQLTPYCKLKDPLAVLLFVCVMLQMFQLLIAHFRYTLPINAAARGSLINANGKLFTCPYTFCNCLVN